MTGKFLRISCPRCGKSRIVYGKSSTNIKCDECNLLLLKTTGGKTKIMAFIRRIFNGD